MLTSSIELDVNSTLQTHAPSQSVHGRFECTGSRRLTSRSPARDEWNSRFYRRLFLGGGRRGGSLEVCLVAPVDGLGLEGVGGC